ncbi:MAG: type II toxin-antitoxin system RelE/ParE family toxin [Hyphomicrobiaceae bacterium]|nr:type II toxin-antitoxin system RelE/ParE family toxin [Hyphomicrobiaceae bacterium]
MKVRLVQPALVELDEAADWYAAISAALEQRFLAEVAMARMRIAEHPNAWHPLDDRLRRYRLQSFPYGLIYAAGIDDLVIVAIAHLHRQPEYWRDRLPLVDLPGGGSELPE